MPINVSFANGDQLWKCQSCNRFYTVQENAALCESIHRGPPVQQQRRRSPAHGSRVKTVKFDE